MPRGPFTCTTPHAQQCQDVATKGLWLGLIAVLDPWIEFVCGGGGLPHVPLLRLVTGVRGGVAFRGPLPCHSSIAGGDSQGWVTPPPVQ